MNKYVLLRTGSMIKITPYEPFSTSNFKIWITFEKREVQYCLFDTP